MRAPLVSLFFLGACSSSPSGVAADGGPADAAVKRIDARTTCDDAGAGASCDPFLSCGCQATEKCAPGEVGLACLPLGTQQPGQTCVDDTSCARGATCVVYAGATTCHAFCDDAHTCATGTACYIKADDRSGHPVATICGPGCLVLSQTCPGGLGCYPAAQAEEPDQGLHGICLTPGAGGQGTICVTMSNCKIGYACIDADAGGPNQPICAKICDRKGSGPSCDQATEGMCRAFASQAGNSQTGVCLP